MKHLDYSCFKEQLDTVFFVQAPGGAQAIELTLVKATHSVRHSVQEVLTLVFQGPVQPVLTQQMYRFQHQQLGELMLFMVPIAQNGSGTMYEVVFNRLLEQNA